MVVATERQRFIGLMSGTSLDGVDGALCEFDADGTWRGVISHAWLPFQPALRDALWNLQTSGPGELHLAALASNGLARVYADVCHQLTRGSSDPVIAIGAHGQTVRHQPGQQFVDHVGDEATGWADETGYTLQLLAPALLAHLTSIDVVADFRSADVAAGGQGAPLVPPFHQAVFGGAMPRAVVNIGGISNLTLLVPGQAPRGFDCGPGNALMDHWIQRHRGLAFDQDGGWASQGLVVPDLLAHCLSEPYFDQTPPKSTGRDLFNPAWLDQRLALLDRPAEAVDVQATLCELAATAIARDFSRHACSANVLLVCGGGAFNHRLMDRLRLALPSVDVRASDTEGLPAMQVEAAAFAWLAKMHVSRKPANEPAVTGATRPKILGAYYPA